MHGSRAPLYFISLLGKGMHWRTRGSNVVYAATPTGFRVAIKNDQPLVPAQAEALQWRISWIGLQPTSTKAYSKKMGTIKVAASGVAWELDDDGSGLHLDVLAKARAVFGTVGPTERTGAPLRSTQMPPGTRMHTRMITVALITPSRDDQAGG